MAVLPPLLYPGYIEFHVGTRACAIYVPADRELTIVEDTPVLL